VTCVVAGMKFPVTVAAALGMVKVVLAEVTGRQFLQSGL
jgi:hypothetical protein